MARTPHYDGVIAGGSEPAVIHVCHLQTKAEQQPYFIAAATPGGRRFADTCAGRLYLSR